MVQLQPIFKRAYWFLVITGAIYVTAFYFATYPAVQRSFLYVNRLNPSWAHWHDVNDVEKFGFLPHQIQPFTVTTPDNETLYAWHILPAHLAHEHEAFLKARTTRGPAHNFSETGSFELLASDPDARVVVNFHGNALDLASGFRPQTYRALLAASSPSRHVHVIAFDYRGYGLSTGVPTEAGLITDGMAVLNHLTNTPLDIARPRIVAVGHSLGTAVVSGVMEGIAEEDAVEEKAGDEGKGQFAGVVLMAGFGGLKTLLETYSFFGVFPPLLSPLVQYPRAQRFVLESMVDTWETERRMGRLVNGAGKEEEVKAPFKELAVVHASDDFEIPWRNGWRIWEAATGLGKKRGNATAKGGSVGEVVRDEESQDKVTQSKVWERKVSAQKEGGEQVEEKGVVKRVRWERVRYGGHNQVTAHTHATMTVLRIFDEKTEENE